jgi:low temperature requirement protein LtrA
VSELHVEVEHRVTPLELFFDLVFVFGFTQVTALILERPTWSGLGHGLLVLAVLWWAWAAYAWLTNTVDADSGVVIAVMLVASAAMFVAALSVPEAFGKHRLIFGLAFVIVLLMQVALFTVAAKSEPDLLQAVLRSARTSLPGGALILAAAFVPGSARPAVWVAGLLVGLLGPLFIDLTGWRVHAAHFAERHGLILIIALGESLVAIGLGARRTELSAGVIVSAVLGLGVAASFWLGYFDFFSIGAQRLLSELRGVQRIALARDVYTYLHLPMVAGIVLFAFGVRRTLPHVGADLNPVSALGLCGGSALYLLSYVCVRLRVSGQLSRGRSVATIAFAALIPVALVVPAVAALALVAAVWLALHAYELIWWREQRAERRARVAADPSAQAT